MNDNAPNRDSINAQTPAEPTDWREERRRRREERRGGGWVGGVILIALGVIFLLQNTGRFTLENWWAIFILIPAFGAFGAAWSNYRAAGGRLTPAVGSSLVGGVVLTLVAAAFLLNIDWRWVGPGLLILAGIGLLGSNILRR